VSAASVFMVCLTTLLVDQCV